MVNRRSMVASCLSEVLCSFQSILLAFPSIDLSNLAILLSSSSESAATAKETCPVDLRSYLCIYVSASTCSSGKGVRLRQGLAKYALLCERGSGSFGQAPTALRSACQLFVGFGEPSAPIKSQRVKQLKFAASLPFAQGVEGHREGS